MSDVLRVVVTAPPSLFLLASAPCVAVAELADGRRERRPAQWRVEPEGRVVIDHDGTITAAASGLVQITATVDGVSGTATVRTLPCYGGPWRLRYTLTDVSADPDSPLAPVLASFWRGQVFDVQEHLEQPEFGADVSITFSRWGAVASLDAPIALDGSIFGGAQVQAGPLRVAHVFRLHSWDGLHAVGSLRVEWCDGRTGRRAEVDYVVTSLEAAAAADDVPAISESITRAVALVVGGAQRDERCR